MTTGPHPCYLCGKDVKAPRFWVEGVDGGSRLRLASDPPADQSDPGYMGWYPVGADCARRLRGRGVAVVEEAARATC